MNHHAVVQELGQELFGTGSASADLAELPVIAQQWRRSARQLARAKGRRVRTFLGGSTVHAVLTDWPANDTEEAVLAESLRRGINTLPPPE